MTFSNKHGKLLQKWFGKEQPRYLELETKIGERRKNRNQTFLDYKRRKNSVANWTIPPGPTQEERYEIEDEEGEQLRDILDPIVTELKESKKRLRELRQKRLEAANERARKESGTTSLDMNASLPQGFESAVLAKKEEPASSSASVATPAAPSELPQWGAKKKEADKAFGQKDWNTAISMYTQALEIGADSLDATTMATILSNRSLVHAKLFDWTASFEDALAATEKKSDWAKGWLRRATAEVRLGRNREGLSSLKKGVACAGKLTGQFLGLVTECESGLYADVGSSASDKEAPNSAAERIDKFREDGGKAFEQKNYGFAVLSYTRALYHRAMMEQKVEAIILSNRAAAFLKLELPSEALADALAAAEKDPQWSKPLVRAGSAAMLLQDFKSAYQHYAKARKLDENYPAANEGLNDYPKASEMGVSSSSEQVEELHH